MTRREKTIRVQHVVMALAGASAIALMAAAPGDANDDRAEVTLTIDFANGFEMRYALPDIDEGATVLDVMLIARAHNRPLAFTYKGKGDGAFLMSIENLENELNGPKSKNWLFWVNGDFAKRGLGTMKVHDGDEIKWRFAGWKDDGK